MKPIRLSRRAVLQSFGAGGLALPLLEAMVDGRGYWFSDAEAQVAGAPPVRFMFFHITNGMSAESFDPFTPTATGANYPLSPVLQGLEGFSNRVNVLTGLRHTTYHECPGDDEHAKCSTSLLTGFPCTRETASGRTLDHQLRDAWAAAGYQGMKTMNAICDSSNPGVGADRPPIFNSWEGEFQMTQPIADPLSYFKEIFGADAGLTDAPPTPGVDPRVALRQSVLDYVKGDAEALKLKLGVEDRARVELHLSRVRELEQEVLNVSMAPALIDVLATKAARDEYEALSQGKKTYEPHIKAMVKLSAMALQVDRSRVGILQYGWPFGNYQLPPEAGISGGSDHGTSHGNNPGYLPWVQYKVKTFRYLLEVMEQAEEVGSPGGTLLGNSVTLGTSDVGLGSHNTDRHGILLAGTAGGKIQTGLHQVFEGGTPINNLMLKFVELLAIPGMQMTKFGMDGTTPLALA